MNEKRSTAEEAQADAQFEYDAISAKVDSVKRKLDGGSKSVSPDQLSTLLAEQQRFKLQLDDANDFVEQLKAARPTRAEVLAREKEQDRRHRQEMKFMRKAVLDQGVTEPIA